ncbi:ABC transporter permease [Chitinimonas sp.]|uniref:ABC transporter permease n=1 Tax=Chitinimonas sp. TaxID=1934313 RepID=UPI002F91E3C3
MLYAPSSLFRRRALIFQLVTREIQGRYRGSLLGVLWSLVTPLLMLAIYTFVFSVVFAARWQGSIAGHSHFALMLFAGIAVFSVFSEIIARAPLLIVQQVNYVKKVVFPIGVLPVVAVGSAAFHALITFVLLIAAAIWQQGGSLTMLALPLILAPFLMLSLGVAWLLSAVGVYLRDLGQVIGMAVTALQFLSPVFYPVSALPLNFQPLMRFNPVTLPIESIRQVVLEGLWPDWIGLGIYSVVAVLVALLGRLVFSRLRRGFADVL